jgi:peptide subunit release factor RF-3
LWTALGRPPSIGIDETTIQVHKKLAEVNSEAMVQLHKRNHKMHELIQNMEQNVKLLRAAAEQNEQRMRQLLTESELSQARYMEGEKQRRCNGMLDPLFLVLLTLLCS